MRQFSILIDLAALLAAAQYFRSSAGPLLSSAKLYPKMGVRPTLITRAILVTVVISTVFVCIDLPWVLLGSSTPVWALAARVVALWVPFILMLAGMRLRPVEMLPQVRAAADIAEGHETLARGEPTQAIRHLSNALAAWERVVELAPENAGIHDRLGQVCEALAFNAAKGAPELRRRAQREFQLGASLRAEHQGLPAPSGTVERTA